ncbi:MAG: hypothetical protein QXF80_06830 [Thermoplasmatales archaeon]
MKMVRVWRQGELVIKEVANASEVAKLINEENLFRATFVVSKTGGREYRIDAPVYIVGRALVLVLKEPKKLIHEGHRELEIPAGIYTFRIVKEFLRDKYFRYHFLKVKIKRKTRGKSKYSLDDILKFGGIRISANEYYYAEIKKDENNTYILCLPNRNSHSILVESKTFNSLGDVIFKVVIVRDNDEVHQVFLIGREYTGEWWMHSLPLGYWRKSIIQCERWLLNLKKGDIIVGES